MEKTITFETIKNNGKPAVMKNLIDLKNIFAKQLPKMPKEYIVRLVFDFKHESIVLKDQKDVIFGGVTYCLFDEVLLCEIVFLAISSEHQIKGFGTILMNQLKTEMQKKKIAFMMTCADNLAIGYFQKQGFHSGLLMPSALYKGYLKDYEGSTLMECLLDDKVNYNLIGTQIRRYKERLHSEIEKKIKNNVVYEGIKENEWTNILKKGNIKQALQLIPGLNQIEGIEKEYYEIEKIKAGSCFRSSCSKIIEQLKNDKNAWPFLHAVKKEEVPDYYDIVKSPMWLTKVEEKVNEGKYETKKEFMDDLNLIISNCRSYNQKNTIYFRKSVELEKCINQIIGVLKEDKGQNISESQNEGNGKGQKVKKIKNE